MKGITQPREGHVESRPRSSSGSPTKIRNQKGAFFRSSRKKKEKIMACMKMEKVSPGFTDQLVLPTSRFLIFMIQFYLGTASTVHLN